MSGQGGHGMRCGRTRFPMGRQPMREEDKRVVDDLREG
jgi:hypothetical protein